MKNLFLKDILLDKETLDYKMKNEEIKNLTIKVEGLGVILDLHLKLCNKEVEFYIGFVGFVLFQVILDLPFSVLRPKL